MSSQVVLQISLLILVFSYIALGPYASIYDQAIEQVKTPAEIAYRSVSNAFYDIYLLATNPTEWYARQQVVNARPEKPISFPKGLEVESLDATPASVPGGQPFVMTFVLKHEGDLPARRIRVEASCNQWCEVPPPQENLERKPFSLCRYERFEPVGIGTYAFYCAESCGEDERVDASILLPDCIAKCTEEGKKERFYGGNLAGAAVGGVIGAGVGAGVGGVVGGVGISLSNRCLTENIDEFKKTYWPNSPGQDQTMRRGDAQIVTLEPFRTNPFQGGEAETRIARIYINVSYEYSTTSQLLVSVMGEDEKQRLIRERKLEFKPVLATTKVSPAKLSMNVGPQPLEAGTEATLLVSVSNDRDNSRIILPEGTEIILTLPLEIGSGLHCAGSNEQVYLVNAQGKIANQQNAVAEQLVYRIVPEPRKDAVEILPYEFNTVYSFICKFTTSSAVSAVKTGIVTANLTSYTFRHNIKKDVPVTTPVGILFDPYEAYCNKCGDGLFSRCNADACHGLSKSDTRNIGTCYYDALLGKGSEFIGTPCRSCGDDPQCSQFTTQPACENEAPSQCGIACRWDPDGTTFVHSIPNKGSCESVSGTGPRVALSGEVVDRIVQAAQIMKPPGADDEVRAEGIANSFEEMILKLAWIENRFRHCKDGTLNCINDKTYGSLICSAPPSQSISSCGIMQIAINKHTKWRTSTEAFGCGGKGAYDADCNIKLGIGLLIENYNHFKGGLQNPACRTEPYRSKYKGYTGWKAAIRAYNGWGCPLSYPGGVEAATNFVENVAGVNLASLPSAPAASLIVTKADLMGLGSFKALRSQAQQAFNEMKAAAKADGLDFTVVSGYRDFNRQLQIWNDKLRSVGDPDEVRRIDSTANYNAIPGISRHHWGTEIDINSVSLADWQQGCTGQSCQGAVYDWLKKNAAKFGFCQPYEQDRLVLAEPWHWSYKPLSKQFTEKHMSEVTANDLMGRGIAGEAVIIRDFDKYHKGFISDVNPECTS